MLKLGYSDSNENSEFTTRLIQVIDEEREDIYLGIGDIELIPRYRGDYPGAGQHEFIDRAYEFTKRVERERIVFMTPLEFTEVLYDSQTIRRAVIICFSNGVPYAYSLRPMVEVKDVNKIQHQLGQLEIRVLDGDLFYILSNDNGLIEILEKKMQEYVLK